MPQKTLIQDTGPCGIVTIASYRTGRSTRDRLILGGEYAVKFFEFAVKGVAKMGDFCSHLIFGIFVMFSLVHTLRQERRIELERFDL